MIDTIRNNSLVVAAIGGFIGLGAVVLTSVKCRNYVNSRGEPTVNIANSFNTEAIAMAHRAEQAASVKKFVFPTFAATLLTAGIVSRVITGKNSEALKITGAAAIVGFVAMYSAVKEDQRKQAEQNRKDPNFEIRLGLINELNERYKEVLGRSCSRVIIVENNTFRNAYLPARCIPVPLQQ